MASRDGRELRLRNRGNRLTLLSAFLRRNIGGVIIRVEQDVNASNIETLHDLAEATVATYAPFQSDDPAL